ncbi:MAG: site-2 protease family protein [Patescibacteria group bacterium]
MTNATDTIFQIIILLMSVVIHEVSHGAMAYTLGDKTAKYHGRLTLNPIPHLDPFGSILLPLLLIMTNSPFLIGWAKPVPYNPYNLRNQKWGPALVGFAGPLSNLIIAIVFGLLIRVANLGVFTFIPLATLQAFGTIAANITFINIILAVFNLVPIPPLDGSKVLAAIVPYRFADALLRFESMGWVLLIVFIFFFSWVISPISTAIFHLITGL